jgi:hypothetical protein
MEEDTVMGLLSALQYLNTLKIEVSEVNYNIFEIRSV